jgi:hypothetical protein
MTRYRWVTARKGEGFPITMACAVADVSRQAFHDWRARTAAGPTAGELAEFELVAVMRVIHARHLWRAAHDRGTRTSGSHRDADQPVLQQTGRGSFGGGHLEVEQLASAVQLRGLEWSREARAAAAVLSACERAPCHNCTGTGTPARGFGDHVEGA